LLYRLYVSFEVPCWPRHHCHWYLLLGCRMFQTDLYDCYALNLFPCLFYLEFSMSL
jgi:hypothetical protein